MSLSKDEYKRQAIESVLESDGWKYIEEIINLHIKKSLDASRVPANLRNDVYVREVRAGIKTAENLKSILQVIKLAAGQIGDAKKKRYV